MSLYRSANDIPVATFDMETASFTTTLVYGNRASLMIAERPPGYHSRPHRHDCEQLNVLQSGELHVYCDGAAYVLQLGDALRIPADAVHWSWNRSDLPCVLLEVHAPGLQDDPVARPFAVPLFANGESEQVVERPLNVYVDVSPEEVSRVEALSLRPSQPASSEA